MAKFCTKCGSELVDGKCPNCKSEVRKKMKFKGSAVLEHFDFNDCFQTFLNMFKGMLARPKDTILKYSKESYFSYSIIAMVLCSLVTGIFSYLFLEEVVGVIASFMYGGFGSLMSENITSTVPAFKTIIMTFLFSAVNFAVMIGGIYFMAKVVFKKKVSYQKIVSSFGPLSIFKTCLLILSIILMYISVKLMMIVYFVFTICYMVYTLHAIQVSTDIDDNKLAYTYVPALLVATFITVSVLPKILG